MKYISNHDKIPLKPKNSEVQEMLLQKVDFGRGLFLSKKKTKNDAIKFKIGLPNYKTHYQDSTAKIASDNTIVYANYENNTDVAVQMFKNSMRILTTLNDINAPTEFVYDIKIPENSEIKKFENGGISILSKTGELIALIAPPWAIDSKGKKIPTYFKVNNKSLIQIVDHRSYDFTYPIVADPFFGYKLIYSVRRDPNYPTNSKIRIMISPTLLTRAVGQYSFIYNRAWSDVRNMRPELFKRNLQGLKDQFACHPVSEVAKYKSTWNIEDWRPNVGPLRTLLAACNP